MDIKKVVLYFALAFILYSLINQWHAEHPVQTTAVSNTQETSANTNSVNNAVNAVAKSSINAPLVTVKTDVLDVTINNAGTITNTTLLHYPVSIQEQHTPFVLLQNNNQEYYVAEQGVMIQDNSQMLPVDIVFNSETTVYQLDDNQNTLEVVLTGTTKEGLKVTKTFKFTRGDYLINTAVSLENMGDAPWKGYVNNALTRTAPADGSTSMFNVSAYTGASYGQPGVHKYQKVTFKDMNKGPLNVSSKGGWIAMQQHYFLTSWIPSKTADQLFYTQTDKNMYSIGMVSQPITLDKNQTKVVENQLYLGPENTAVLKILPKAWI